jgi:histidinol-phosphate aminotransferase
MIVCGNGADELLAILVRCCCDSERPLAYPVPTYSLYPVLAQIQQCPVKEIPFGDDYQIPQGLARAGGALTILCNPNAPTGTFASVDKVAELAGAVDGVLAVDEAYVDFAQDNCLRLLKDFDNLVILRTMSKGYSLAGMRFGYALGSQRIAEAMIKVKDSYNVNAATQAAAVAALSDQEHFLANVEKIVAERSRLSRELRKMGFESGDSRSNFLWVRIASPSAKEVYEKLIERNVYVRYFDKPGLNDKLRITVGTGRENDALLAALRHIIL